MCPHYTDLARPLWRALWLAVVVGILATVVVGPEII